MVEIGQRAYSGDKMQVFFYILQKKNGFWCWCKNVVSSYLQVVQVSGGRSSSCIHFAHYID